MLFQKPDNPQTTGSFILIANELKRKDKYMNVLFSCHVRKVNRMSGWRRRREIYRKSKARLGTEMPQTDFLVAEVKFSDAKDEEKIFKF